MAQHFKVHDEKIWRSIKRIVPSVFSDIRQNLLMDWCYYQKQIRHLPKEFNPAGFAFTIAPYNMAKVWKRQYGETGGAQEEATLEVHLDLNGNLTDVFYPL